MNPESLLLCIDTSTPVGSLALVDKRGFVAGLTRLNPASHTEKLYTLAGQMLSDCGLGLEHLSGVAVAAGPGSFTGLRIAAATAKTLAWSLKLPLYAAGTLECLAWGAHANGEPVLAVLDAGQSEYYCGAWLWRGAPEPAEELLPPCSLDVDALAGRMKELFPGGRVTCVGQVSDSLRERLTESLRGELARPASRLDLPDAAFLGELALAAPEKRLVRDIYAFEPLYVRTGQVQLRLGK